MKKFNDYNSLIDYINQPNDEYDYFRKGKYDFENCDFRFDLEWSLVISRFESEVNFDNTIFQRPVKFDSITFEEKVTFQRSTFKSSYSFKEVVFLGEAKFEGYLLFPLGCNFQGSHFFERVKLPKNFASTLDLSYCTFHKSLDLSKTFFDGNLKLNDSIFLNNVYFNESTFNRKINAWSTRFEKHLIFRWTNFRKKINLTDSSIENGTADFFGANFENNAYFYNTKFRKINLKNSVIEKGVFFLGAIIKKTDRETYRIIKNQFLKQNNRIEALKFHHKEMNAYTKEIIIDSVNNLKKFKLWRFSKNLGDFFVLILNFISNGPWSLVVWRSIISNYKFKLNVLSVSLFQWFKYVIFRY